MNFLSPIAFAFAASLGVVIVFYMLKRKRVIKLVSSTLLWQKFLAETQASSPLQKLRHNWLLLLQLLLLLLVVVALARPFFTGQAPTSRLRVLVLDGSASMQSTDIKPSRFQQAKSEALTWVNGMRDGEQMMVLLAAGNTEVKQSPTGDKAALRRAIESCAAADTPTRLADAIKTAGAFTFEKRGEETVTSGEIHLFSDGAVTDLEPLANKNLPLVYHKIGQDGRNAGLVNLDVKVHPEDPSQRAIFAAVFNASTNLIAADIELSFDGQSLEVRPLTLTPTNTQPLVFFAPQQRDGVFTLKLKIDDDLAADNQASIVSLIPAPVKALLLTQGNRFLEKALRAASPNLQLTVAGLLADGAENYDLVVIDNMVPIVWPNINTLAINTANTNWLQVQGTIQGPPIVDWRSAHPLLRFVNFDNVQVAEAMSVRPPGWGLPLVESPATPLLLAGELDQRRLIWIGFDPLQSTWPLRISFPIFIANAVDWLNPSSLNTTALQVKAGDPFRLNLYQTISSARVTMPDGQQRDVATGPNTRELVFGQTASQGVYRLQAGTNSTTFCVNLLDAAESQILARDQLPLGKYESIQASTLRRANLELWRWIAAAGLLVLLFEWWFYHKRTV